MKFRADSSVQQWPTSPGSLQAVARSCAMYGEVEEASAWVEGQGTATSAK